MQKKIIMVVGASVISASAMAQSLVEIYGTVDMSAVTYTGSYSGQVAGTVNAGIAANATAGTGAVAASPNGVFNGVGKSGYSSNGLAVGTGVPLVEYGSRAEMLSNSRNTSVVGFRGTEDLGSGLKASFVIESSLAGDGGTANGSNSTPLANILGDRETTVALAGAYGKVKVGLQSSVVLDDLEAFDVFGGNGIGNVNRMVISPLTNTRFNNTVRYDTPIMYGVKVTAQYSLGEGSDRLLNTSGTGSISNIGARYTAGPLDLAVGHLVARDFGAAMATSTTATANAASIAAGSLMLAQTTAAGQNQAEVARLLGGVYSGRTWSMTSLGGAYDFGVAKLSGFYVTSSSTKNASDSATPINLAIQAATANTAGTLSTLGRGEAIINSSTYGLGLTVPLGNHKLLGEFVSTNDKRTYNMDGRSLALGYEYTLSKRTTLYARGAKVYNTNGSSFGVTGLDTSAIAFAQPGSGAQRTSAYLAGVSHSF